METLFYPLQFQPVYQTYLWGGGRLRQQLNRLDAPEGIVAESWEVTDRPDGMSVVRNGPQAGKSLRELIEADAAGILGRGHDPAARFPLLIKVLDAAQTLSVQVHPNDATAAEFGGEAKTEMWYVLDAAPDAVVYCGLKEGVTPERFRTAIAKQRLEEWMVTLPVKAGDAIFVPGGRVHAIGAGCLLLEVQQNSNTTYRIYDWGRVGADGKARELHVAQALEVTLWRDPDSALTPAVALPRLPGWKNRELILQSPYFRLEKLETAESTVLRSDGSGFQVLFALEDPLTLTGGGETVVVAPGSSVLLPAGLREVILPAGARFVRITER